MTTTRKLPKHYLSIAKLSAKDQGRYAMGHIQLNGRLIATDGKSLACISGETFKDHKDSAPIYIDRESALAVAKSKIPTKTAGVTVDPEIARNCGVQQLEDGSVELKTLNFAATGSKVQGHYPPVEDVLACPKTAQSEAHFNVQLLLDALNLAKELGKESPSHFSERPIVAKITLAEGGKPLRIELPIGNGDTFLSLVMPTAI